MRVLSDSVTKFTVCSGPPYYSRGHFWVDSDAGMVAASTDYGNYMGVWPIWPVSGVSDFQTYLSKLDKDDVLIKLCSAREYDGGSTILAIRQEILRLRHDRSLSKLSARCEWDLLEEAGLELEGGFQAWFDATHLEDPETLYRWRFPSQADSFYDHLYVKFIAELKGQGQ